MVSKQDIIKEYKQKLNNNEIIVDNNRVFVPFIDSQNVISNREAETIPPSVSTNYQVIEFKNINGYWDVVTP